ncbi:ClpP/crotonase-like domain-containing protein [Chytriomyces sp. MP71]|nr:ClpP/crotonase-like domain-containing protein [Chytriomyces sp. MP71]
MSASAAAEVLVKRLGNMQMLLLNRPVALNALNLNMIQLLAPKIKAFDESSVTSSILLSAVEGKAFCAGGDIKALTQAKTGKPEDVAAAVGFMQNEYELNHLIGTVKTPLVALLNGIAMGGGIGLSVHAPFRIATENTVFAMPETGIGLFPDVGGSFFLPRLDGELGTFLGLTGHRLKGDDVFMAGIATHFVPADRLPQLIERLSGLDSPDLAIMNAAIDEFVADAPTVQDWQTWSLGIHLPAINRCFRGDTLEQIVAALEAEATPWAKMTLDKLKDMSPMSLKLTLEQLRRGRQQDFANCFRMEYRMVQETLQSRDFTEGVTAKLLEKRVPVWEHSWEEMSALTQDQIEERFFAKRDMLPESLRLIAPRLEFHNSLTYFEYPHRTLSGLPTDRDVAHVLQEVGGKKDKALELFVREWGGYDAKLVGEERDVNVLPHTVQILGGNGRGKFGLVEKVEAILSRGDSAKI